MTRHDFSSTNMVTCEKLIELTGNVFEKPRDRTFVRFVLFKRNLTKALNRTDHPFYTINIQFG